MFASIVASLALASVPATVHTTSQAAKPAPPSGTAAAATSTIVQTAVAAGNFKTLVAAVQAAGLAETLGGPGPFTVFAPTDEAFAMLPAGTLEMLLKPENKKQLAEILTYHVVPGQAVYSDAIVKMTTVPTVLGRAASVKVVDGKVMVDGATVVAADVAASNGVIHVIDTVILPPASGTAPAADQGSMRK